MKHFFIMFEWLRQPVFFYFCHCFYKAFDNGQILKNSIIYEEKPSSEVICCSFDCRKQFILQRAQ